MTVGSNSALIDIDDLVRGGRVLFVVPEALDLGDALALPYRDCVVIDATMPLAESTGSFDILVTTDRYLTTVWAAGYFRVLTSTASVLAVIALDGDGLQPADAPHSLALRGLGSLRGRPCIAFGLDAQPSRDDTRLITVASTAARLGAAYREAQWQAVIEQCGAQAAEIARQLTARIESERVLLFELERLALTIETIAASGSGSHMLLTMLKRPAVVRVVRRLRPVLGRARRRAAQRRRR